MLFKEIENINFRKYASETTEVRRHIELKKDTAEAINKAIAVVNEGNKEFKLNNTILFNIAIKKLFKDLEKLPTEEAITILRKRALAEMGLMEV